MVLRNLLKATLGQKGKPRTESHTHYRWLYFKSAQLTPKQNKNTVTYLMLEKNIMWFITFIYDKGS